MNDTPRRARATLPRLTGAEAILVVDLLDRITEAIWRVHGDAMAAVLRRDEHHPRCDDTAPTLPDDDEIPF